MKVLIAGGGTGGHVYPGIAVAEELKRARARTPRSCSSAARRGLEAAAVPEAGFRIRFIAGARLPAPRLVALAGRGCSRTWSASAGAAGSWLRERPDVVLGTGGYVSGPVALAAWLLRPPAAAPGAEQHSRARQPLAGAHRRRGAPLVRRGALVLRAQGPPQGDRQPDARLHPERRPRPARCASSGSRRASRRCSCSAAAAARTASTRRRSTRCAGSRAASTCSSSCRPGARTSTGRSGVVERSSCRRGCCRSCAASTRPTPRPTWWCAARAP